jgi:probable F420-dependent oxidoreductase
MEFSTGAGLTMTPKRDVITLADYARAAEDHGFESIFFGEHTHIPVEQKTPFPVEARFRVGALEGPNGKIPPFFASFLDPIVAATAAACATTTLKVGFSVLLVPQRDPIVLAKEISTLDQLSKGRVIFGVGTGWLDEELENHGGDPKHRTGVLMERVEAIKAIWTNEEAEFHGRFVNFDKIWQAPKPYQQPHPPIMLGGHGPGILKRVVKLGAEWLAPATRMDADGLRPRMQELDELVRETGAPRVKVTFGAPPDPPELEKLAEMGIDRCSVQVQAGPTNEVLQQFKKVEKVLAPFNS